jgi:hypothetical protein
VPPIAGPYSLTEILTITAGPNSLTSIDAAIVDAPEPASLSLLSAALLMLAMLGWRCTAVGDRRQAALLRRRARLSRPA